MVDHRSCEP